MGAETCIEQNCDCDLEHESLNCLMMLLTWFRCWDQFLKVTCDAADASYPLQQSGVEKVCRLRV